MSKILEALNSAQQEAVKHIDGPGLVVAGAGSGKTRVLIYRVAYMLEKGINPFNILALTFTNKAAREMKERIEKLVGEAQAKSVWMGTFHSIFARILRAESHKLGYDQNFTIFDSNDSKSIIKKIIKEQNLDDKLYTVRAVAARISWAKSSLFSPVDYEANKEIRATDLAGMRPQLFDVYKRYNRRLRQSMAMDFDDLLYNMNVLLRDHPDMLQKYQQRFSHILVDEFQDTNFAQYLIVRQLSADNQNICVVGDDAQSIYAFRGANIQNILNFKRDYPSLNTFKLEQNYRSSKVIVAAANSIIEHNKNQIQKHIWTDNDQGELITVYGADTDNYEANWVAQQIEGLSENGTIPYDQIAILYRTNNQSRILEQTFRSNQIPYIIYGGKSFYDRKVVRDVLAYFRLVVNKYDQEALLRIINYPTRGIGKNSVDALLVAADKHNVRPWDIIENIHQYEVEISEARKNKVHDFALLIQRMATEQKEKDAFVMADEISKLSGMRTLLSQDKSAEGLEQLANLEELLNAVKIFVDDDTTVDGNITDVSLRTLDLFMQEVSLVTDADKNKQDGKSVTMMTIHASKGLEFPYIFIVGVEENIFPNIQALASPKDLEEERRLFYVAVTRAEKQLFISFAEQRFNWGKLNFSEPSRFISEIDAQYVKDETGGAVPSLSQQEDFSNFSSRSTTKSGRTPTYTKAPQKRSASSVQKTQIKMTTNTTIPSRFKLISSTPKEKVPLPDHPVSSELSIGMKVEHKLFGVGEVKEVEGVGENKKATVFFIKVGNKRLLLKFARLKVLS